MDIEVFLTSALYLLAVIAISIAFSKRLGLGSILGLLVAGVIVGPHSPGPVWTDEVETVRHITEFGVVLLLFLIGLEMQPRKLWEMRRSVFGLGSAQILVSGALIFAYLYFYATSWQAALLVGLTFALSSTAFVMQLLQEKGELYTETGRSGFSILLMQDIAVVPLLALVPILADKGDLSAGHPVWQQFLIAAAAIAFVLWLGRYLVPKALDYLARQRNKEAFFFTVIFSVVLACWLMEHAGLSMALGAFLIGMMLSSSRYHFQIQAYVEPYKGLLMSLFFVGVGMTVDINALSENPLTLAQHLFVIMGIKIAVLFGLMLYFGSAKTVAIKVSFLLAQSGEFGFVLFGAAKALGVIGEQIFVAGITIISISMLLTPMVVQAGDKLSERIRQREQKPVSSHKLDDTWNGVIIAGYGRVGHIVSTMLENVNIPYVAFDMDAAKVNQGRTEGRPVYYGELSDYDFLSNVGLEQASLVIVTVDSHHTAIKIISHIRDHYPALPILARTQDMRTRDLLIGRGASWAIPETIEGSLRLGAEALINLGKPEEEIQSILNYFRKDDYEVFRG